MSIVLKSARLDSDCEGYSLILTLSTERGSLQVVAEQWSLGHLDRAVAMLREVLYVLGENDEAPESRKR